jgi:hypothetical protein
MSGSSCPESVSTKLQRIAKLAKDSPEMVMTTLAHHIDVAFLREAYRRTRKDGAAGIDGRTAKDYAAELEANLEDLLARFKSGRYRAPAVRRVQIPKGGGKTRPIGIPTFVIDRPTRATLVRRSGREIARLLHMGRNTVSRYRQVLQKAGLLEGDADELPELATLRCAVGEQLPSRAPQQKSKLERWLPIIDEKYEAGVGPKAIHDYLRLEHEDFDGSLSAVKRRCSALRRARKPREEDVAICAPPRNCATPKPLNPCPKSPSFPSPAEEPEGESEERRKTRPGRSLGPARHG